MASEIEVGACGELEPPPTPTPEQVSLEAWQAATQEVWDALVPDLIVALEEADDIERVDALTMDAYATSTSGRIRIAATTIWASNGANGDVGWDIVTALADGAGEPDDSQPSEWEGTALDLELSGHNWSCSAAFMRGVRDRQKSRNDFDAECGQ